MITLFNFRSNKRTKARTSNKIWKISRDGRSVTRKWGRGVMRHSRPQFAGDGHKPLRTRFRTEQLAKEFVKEIVARKIREGYDRLKRRRR